jgi:predicted nucleic acid-binding protein
VQLKATVDSSVLIALGKLGYLKLVGEIFDKLVVAESVLEEIRGDEVCNVVSELTGDGLVEVAKGSNYELLNLLSSSLGKGEAETIVVALGLEADVALLDDLRARKTARRLKVKVMGTLAVLKVLIDLKLVKEKPEDLCEKLISKGFWVDAESCLKILKG